MPSSKSRKAAGATALAVVALAVAACGEAETAEDRAAAAVEKLQADLAAGRVRAVCAAMSRRPQRQIGSVGHGRRPTTCERDLRSFVAEHRDTTAAYGEEEDLRRTPRPSVVRVEVGPGGRRASVTMTLGRDPFRVPLVMEAGRWKLDDFFGVVGPPPKALR